MELERSLSFSLDSATRPYLNQSNTIHILTLCSFCINFNAVISSTHVPPALPFWIRMYACVYIYNFYYTHLKYYAQPVTEEEPHSKEK